MQICSRDVIECSSELKFLYKTVRELVARTEPHLITLSGDIAYGEQEDYLNNYKAFAEFVNSFDIPWTLVFGNHDHSGGEALMRNVAKEFLLYSDFVFELGDENMGVGNFVIEITEAGHPVFALIMTDSHDRTPYNGELTWARLYPCQIKWYKEQVERLNAEGCLGSALIMHIPIYAYREAFALAYAGVKEPSEVTYEESLGSDIWNEGYKASYGLKYEDICSYPEDEGMLDAIVEGGNTKLVLCGHDHVNCFKINCRGIDLMYSLKTGKGCYCNKAMNGGTLLSISSDGNVSPEHIFVLE